MDAKDVLKDWTSLNDYLRECKSEKELDTLLKAEVKGKGRGVFLSRIYSRFNRLRAARERREWHSKL